MVELSQVILVIVITTLTILLTVIGIHIVYILREVRRSLEKINKMLDDAGMITESIAQPISGLRGVVGGINSAVKAIVAVGKLIARKKKETQSKDGTTG